MSAPRVFALLQAALAERSVAGKLVLVEQLKHATNSPELDWQTDHQAIVCGTPDRPPLVPPAQVIQRSPATLEGRIALLHAIAHIEFSAINLALDHALRFPELPQAYTLDWIGVAEEEVRHFRMIRQRLQALGHDYGDFPAHEGLWQMAERTAGNPLARMALIPRMLEARGLDVTPPMQEKLEQAGDTESARLLDTILNDEIGHVALGDKWFRWLCQQQGQAPEPTYRRLLAEYHAPRHPRQLNETARLAAGFSREELAALPR